MPSIVTWNLNGLEAHRLDERMEAACMGLLLAAPPDIVLLQEVVDRSLTAHLKPHFSNAGYAAAIQPASGEYYCAAFVRSPLKLTGAAMHAFPRSPQGRVLLEIEFLQGFTPWRIGTAHLESGPTAQEDRREQLDYCLQRLVDHSGPAVFAGDTNMRAREHADLPGEIGARDVWIELGSAEASRSTWAPPGKLTGRRWFRFDRMYANQRVELAGLEAFQKQTERDPVDCSDHRGLRLICSAR